MSKIALFNTDCYKLLKHIPSHSIDLVCTDPPYKIETQGAGFFNAKHLDKHQNQIKALKMSKGFNIKILDELVRVMKHINIYLWCSRLQLPDYMNYFANYRCNWNLLKWCKTNPAPCCGNSYLPDTEYCLYFRAKGVRVYGSYKTKHTYYITPQNVKDKRKWKCPTIKPLPIIRNLVINSSKPNQIVLDPFMGSGTTGVACKKLNRKFIGCEINKKCFRIAQKRIKLT